MTFSYQFSKKDSKEFIKRKHWKTNFICLGLFTVAFIGLNSMLIPYNLAVFFLTYLVYFILIMAILLFFNFIFTTIEVNATEKLENYYGTFTYELNEQGLYKKMDKGDFSIPWESNPKIKLQKHWITVSAIVGKERVTLLFYDQSFPVTEDFMKVQTWLKDRMQLVSVKEEPLMEDSMVSKKDEK